ncbi:MAG TPA: alpha/beta fold hydrolase [Thermoanaerobaculia bacterium]|nr:alpha/beta fold hydrolase [Thermoanaerobaculia bacterium]
MRIAALLLTLFAATAAVADAVEDVRQAELAFAKAFADRDKAKFFSFVTDDATFLSPVSTLRGKEAVVAGWTRYFARPQAPFAWAPDRVSVSADGTMGLSSGPVFLPDGTHAGSFVSTWRKQADGSWKIIFDSSGPGPAVMQEHVQTVEEGVVTTPDGVKLRYRKIGSAPVALVVPLDYVFFDSFRQFADLATVITYDPRNRGRSDRAANQATWTVQQDVEDLETLRKHFKLERIIPVGFSYLGKMVMLYAAAHPDRVQGVIQLGPAANQPSPPAAPQADFGAPKELIERVERMRAEGAAEKTPREFCNAFWEMFRYYMVGDPKNAARYSVEMACAHQNEWGVNLFPVLGSVMASLNRTVLEPAELSKIGARVLTIHGTADRNAPYAAGRAWSESLPNARLLTLPAAAHAMWLDDPVTTYSAIRAFLRGEWPLDTEQVRK